MLTVNALAHLRPYLYHLTAAENISRIQRTRRLNSAAQLFEAAGRPDLIRVRRRQHERVHVEGEQIVIRDQAPLHRGNVGLEPEWEFEDLIAMLNRQVFFWPGGPLSPIAYGVRHFERYGSEDTRIIRVPLVDLVAVNDSHEPHVCRYNSGSPRCNGGRPSPRSANTFVPLSRSELRPGQVVEVTLSPSADLPLTAVVTQSLSADWEPLFR